MKRQDLHAVQARNAICPSMRCSRPVEFGNLFRGFEVSGFSVAAPRGLS